MITNEQTKKVLCDFYCKYQDRANQVIKASNAHPDNKPLMWMREGAENMLKMKCSECILNGEYHL